MASKVPKVELPFFTPPASKSYNVLLRLVIVAVHCDVAFTITEEGVQETDIVGVGGGVLVLPPPQEFRTSSVGRIAKTGSRPCHRDFRRHKVPFAGSTRNPPELTGAGLPDGERHASD